MHHSYQVEGVKCCPSCGQALPEVPVFLEGDELVYDGRRARMSGVHFGILAALLKKFGKPVAQETLISRVWGDKEIEVFSNLYVQINSLRKSLAPFGLNIKNHRGFGYALDWADQKKGK